MLLRKGCRGKEVRKLQRMLHLYEDGIFGALTEEAVRDFQKRNNLKVDGIVGDATWEVLRDKCIVKSTRYIGEIIVHCTATQEGKYFTVKDITRWHKQRGFSDIGYHYVIYLDGSLHSGRDVDISGAHCEGHNTSSIGVCYVGGCDRSNNAKDTRTDAQKKALLSLLKELRKLYPSARIKGHRDYAAKACPSFDATREYSNI